MKHRDSQDAPHILLLFKRRHHQNQWRWTPRRWTRFGLLMLMSLWLCVGTISLGQMMPAQGQTPITQSSLDWVQQGQTAFQAGDYSTAIERWQQAQADYERQGDVLNQGVVLINLTQAYQQLGQWEAADDAIATTLTLLRPTSASQHHNHLMAQARNTQGSLLMSQGKLEAALEAWQHATDFYGKTDDQDGLIRSQLNQAQVLQTLGFYRRSRSITDRVNASLTHQPDSILKAASLRQLGTVLWLIGDVDAAKAALTDSLAVATHIKSNSDISATLLSQGAIATTEKRTDRALEIYQQVEATTQQPLIRLQALVNQLPLAIAAQQWPMAQTIHSNIQALVPQLPADRAVLTAQLSWHKTLIEAEKARLAKAHNPDPQLSSFQTLARQLAQLERQAEALGDVRAQSYALGTLAHLYEETQQYQQALRLTQQALQLAQSLRANDILYQWQWQIGRIHEALAQIDSAPGAESRATQREAAISAYGATLKTLKNVRQDLLALKTDQQFDFRDNVEPVYRQFVDLLLQPDAQRQTQDQSIEEALDTMDALRLAELENFLRCNLDDRGDQHAALNEIDPNAVFIYPILLDQRLEIIYQLPGQSLKHRAVNVSRPEVNDVVEKLRASLLQSRATDDVQEYGQILDQWLIQPLRDELAQLQPSQGPTTTLVFVLEPALQNIPMGVLYHQERYLIEDFAIALVPSRQLFDPSPRSPRLRVLTAGVSESQQVDGRRYSALPNVATELTGIQDITGTSQRILLNQTFTGKRLRANLNPKKLPIVHIATHGKFSSDPDQTFLLAWGQKIKLQDLHQLLQTPISTTRARIELLVLSACETAKGNPRAALGLAGAAVQANVRTTVATLWQVNDQSTATLMQQFYTNLHQGDSIAEALRQAQLELLQDRNNRRPHFWAPFVVVGNWM